MPSLKEEALRLQQQQDDWYVASIRRERTSQITTDHQVKITCNAEPPPPDHLVKKRILYVDTDTDNGDDLVVVERSKKKAKLVGTGAKTDCSKRASRVDMEDKDYLAFLEMLSANEGFYGKSGDYCLDFPRKVPVEIADCGGFEKPLEDDADPHYKIFLENTREDGSSYGFEITNEDGTKVFLRYEEMEDSPYEDIGEDDGNQLDDTPSEERRNDSTVKMTPKIEPLDDNSEQGIGHGGENPSPTTPHWFLWHCKPGTISSADKSYLKFLDHVWVDGDSFTYKNGDTIVKYDADGNVMTGSKEVGKKSGDETKFRSDADQKRTSNTAVHDDDGHDDTDSNSVHILDEEIVKSYYQHGKSFRNNLREVLAKPFDKKEFSAKYKEARLRKQMEKVKHMRGREVDYQIERRRLSYLDRHPEFANMLKDSLEKHDLPRALALLRCLFYYYEYCSHEGSFYPWKSHQPWLHNILCCCPDRDNLNCPMKKHQTSHGKRWSSNPNYK